MSITKNFGGGVMKQDVGVMTMRERFLNEQFSTSSKDANIEALCKIAGSGLQLTKLRSAILVRQGSPGFQIRKGQKHLVACLLIETLLDDEKELSVRGDLFEQVSTFCRPFSSTEKYPMMNHVRGGPFVIENPVFDE